MARLNIVPSRSPDVALTRYDEASFPEFHPLFESAEITRLPQFLLLDRNDAQTAVVLENRSEKAITALKYRWVMVDNIGEQRSRTTTSDSYGASVFQAVMATGERQIISGRGTVSKSLIDQVLDGDGVLGAHSSVSNFAEAVEITFTIDLILFADGEISGPDRDKYALELLSRKRAAEFVAEQVRLANAENRDAMPVLRALSEIPSLGRLGSHQGDPLVHNTKHFAEYLLHFDGRFGDAAMVQTAGLRYLENHPTLPKLYRRPQ